MSTYMYMCVVIVLGSKSSFWARPSLRRAKAAACLLLCGTGNEKVGVQASGFRVKLGFGGSGFRL